MSGDDNMRKLSRRYPFGVAVIALATALWLVVANMYVGFPDSSYTDLDRAELPLVSVFNWISIAVASWCICLGAATGQWQVRRAFFYTCALYAAVIFLSLLLDLFFRATLFDGRGG